MRKDNLVHKLCWEIEQLIKLDHFLIPYPRVNSKWIKNVNVRPGTIKLEENTGSKLLDIGLINLRNIFGDMSPQAKVTKTKINKWNYI